jgi:hypothetical protein
MGKLRIVALVVVVAGAGLLGGGVATGGAEAPPAELAPVAAGAGDAGLGSYLAGGAVAAPAPAAAPAAQAVGPPAPAAPAAVPAVPAPNAMAVGAPCIAAARACVKLSTNQAWLLENGVVTYGPTPIRHGRAGWRTPPGTFKVTFKSRHHRSTLFDGAPMPFAVFFNGGIAFHQGSLGSLSHGCIRMTRAAASTFFANLQRGDVVQVLR